MMTLLSRTMSKTSRATTNALIHSPTIKNSSSPATFIPRRYASNVNFTSVNPLKSSKATSKVAALPAKWSPRLFELPKPRPIEKQRYESTVGVLESASLVLAVAVVGTLYGRDTPVEVGDSNAVESAEDVAIHDWIRPFDHYVGEDGVPVQALEQSVLVQENVEEEPIVDVVDDRLSPSPSKTIFRLWH